LIAFRVDGPRAWDLRLINDWTITDENATYRTELRNGVLVHYILPPDFTGSAPDATFILTRPTLIDILVNGTDMGQAVTSGSVTVTGDPGKLAQLTAVLDRPDPHFNIVTP
jgi:alkyl sulfatase BDS1-like metallo-beta-lactamase superfamily hydrolase